jgi:transposase
MRAGKEASMHGSISSEDLRVRVIGVVKVGLSRNAAARRFGVSISSAVRWVGAFERSGRTAPKPQGGDRRSGRIEAQADILMGAIEETPDATLAELRERLIAERGESFALSTIHCFYHHHAVTFKKSRRMPASRRAPT